MKGYLQFCAVILLGMLALVATIGGYLFVYIQIENIFGETGTFIYSGITSFFIVTGFWYAWVQDQDSYF